MFMIYQYKMYMFSIQYCLSPCVMFYGVTVRNLSPCSFYSKSHACRLYVHKYISLVTVIIVTIVLI